MAESAAQNTYTLVDDIFEVYEARQDVRTSAETLLETRRLEYKETGELTYQPVDALSTAYSVLEAEYLFGKKSEQYRNHYSGLVLDCQRLVGEWYRKKKPEYFPATRHVFDDQEEEFFSHGLSVRQMTENALTPFSDNPEEEARRINERVEDATPQILRSLGHIAIGDQVIRTVSECTDKAVGDYQYDMDHGLPHRGYNGYVPEIKKVMIRDISFKDKTNDRFEEQIGLPGIYITHEIIQMALAEGGAEVDHMDKTDLHGAQILARDNLMDFVEHLDEIASREWCTNVFIGEEVPKDFNKNYETFRQEALIRQEGLKDLAETTAQFVLDLAHDQFDRRRAPGHVEEFVKKLLIDVAKQDMVIAEQIFDEKTAVDLQRVSYLESIGQHQKAFELQQIVEKTAPGGGFCGAGSCGLEGINQNSKEGKELVKKLDADSSDTIVKDKERACRCGKKTIVYAYNKDRVTKYCESCGSFESKVSKAA